MRRNAELSALEPWKRYAAMGVLVLIYLGLVAKHLAWWAGAHALQTFESLGMIAPFRYFGGKRRGRWLQVHLARCPPCLAALECILEADIAPFTSCNDHMLMCLRGRIKGVLWSAGHADCGRACGVGRAHRGIYIVWQPVLHCAWPVPVAIPSGVGTLGVVRVAAQLVYVGPWHGLHLGCAPA
jgi:hypothetical protein